MIKYILPSPRFVTIATLFPGVNNAMIYGSASGGVALILIIAILVLLYVLIKQKEKKNYVPPKGEP